MVIPLLKYRGLIWRNAVADLRHRYAGTGLGVVWNVLHPLALIAVFSLVFSVIMRPQGVKGPWWYVLYLCSGLLPWLAFSECVTRGANAFSENATYLKKLPIPEQVFVAQTAASATLGLAVSFSLLLVIAVALGQRPTVHWLLLPLPLVALQALGFGLGLLCGTLNVFFRDIGQLLTVVLQVVMWTVPVVYLAEQLPQFARPLLAWHPLFPPLVAIRDLFLSARSPAPWTWAAMLAWPAAVLLLAGLVFGRLRREIRDVL
jgi:homopolymeric O-antigen transport system permease protein